MFKTTHHPAEVKLPYSKCIFSRKARQSAGLQSNMTWTWLGHVLFFFLFCARNLRRCIKTSVKNAKKRKKKNGKKRARDDSQVSRVAKQKRLHGDNPGRSPDINFAHNNGHSSSPSSEGWHNEESNDPANMYVTELVPFSVTFEPSVTVPAKQTAVKNTPGFRDLLAQFCGNSSLIVRETR